MYLSTQAEKLIQKFIEHHFRDLNSEKVKAGLPDFEHRPERIFEEIRSLKLLVEKNQYSKVNPKKFAEYILRELAAAEYQMLEKRISVEKVGAQDKIARVILDYFGDDYMLKKDVIKQYMKSKFYFATEKSLFKYMDGIKEEMKLERLESKLKGKKSSPGRTDIEDLDKMTGVQFEDFLKRFFETRGFKVKTTKASNDQGCDLVLQKLGEKTSVQARRYTGTIGNDAIQQVVASLKFYDCERALVITTSKFTKAAEKLAEANHVELWDREVLKGKLLE